MARTLHARIVHPTEGAKGLPSRRADKNRATRLRTETPSFFIVTKSSESPHNCLTPITRRLHREPKLHADIPKQLLSILWILNITSGQWSTECHSGCRQRGHSKNQFPDRPLEARSFAPRSKSTPSNNLRAAARKKAGSAPQVCLSPNVIHEQNPRVQGRGHTQKHGIHSRLPAPRRVPVTTAPKLRFTPLFTRARMCGIETFTSTLSSMSWGTGTSNQSQSVLPCPLRLPRRSQKLHHLYLL